MEGACIHENAGYKSLLFGHLEMTLEARNCTLNDILSQARPLAVARYQRRYEWTLHEVDQLLSDLVESFRRSDSSAVDPYYFIGSFILHKPGRGNVRIIDGQQRLTSLSIILAAARDLLSDSQQQALIDTYLTIPADPLTGASAKQRLVLHRGDDEFFAQHIVPMGATTGIVLLGMQEHDSHERLRQNTVRARKWLTDELSVAERPEFIRFVTSACRVISITVGDEDDAFRIFETVNNRGRSLRSEDILRVSLIEYATQDEPKRRELLQKWDMVERRVGQSEMPRFVSQLRARRLNGRYSDKALHRDIVDSFATPEEALNFLEDELVRTADIFGEISVKRIKGLGNSSTKRAIDKVLRSLSLVSFDDWMPLAVFFIEHYRGDGEYLLKILKGLDRLAWLYVFRHDDVKIAQDRQRRFGTILEHLTTERDFNPRDCKFDLSPSEKAEMRSVVSGRIDPKWVPLKPLLVRLEDALSNRRAARLIGYTIEHVLPRRPEHDYWFERFDNSLAVVTEYAERIGNLCLVTREINREMDNRPFPEKKAIALEEDSHIDSRLAADFENETDWTKGIIERRTSWLLSRFCDEFDVHA